MFFEASKFGGVIEITYWTELFLNNILLFAMQGRCLLHTGNLAAFVDVTLGDNFTEEAMQRLVEIGFNCVDISGERRPSIVEVTKDVEEILEKERGLVAGPSHGHTTVTLGSELFA
jgi:hypothetical protein